MKHSRRASLLVNYTTVKGINLQAGGTYEVREVAESYVALFIWQTGEIVDFAHSEVAL